MTHGMGVLRGRMASNFSELSDGNQATQGSSMCRDLVGHDRVVVVLSFLSYTFI